MKTVKKYTTFEELKSGEEKVTDFKASEKKHIEFEKLIRAIYSIQVHKNAVLKSK